MAGRHNGSPQVGSPVGHRFGRGLAALLVISSTVGLGTADDNDRMQYAQLRHEQTVSQYTRVYAKFRTEARKKNGEVSTQEIEWWEDGGNVRVKTKVGSPSPFQSSKRFQTVHDHAIKDGVQTYLLKTRDSADRPDNGGSIEKRSRDGFIGTSLWDGAGLVPLNLRYGLFKDFWKLDAWRHRPAPPLPGSDAVGVISQSSEGGDTTVIAYLDPAHDYLPSKKIVYWYAGRLDESKQHAVAEVVEYFPKGPDLPTTFPKRVRVKFYGPNGVTEPPVSETTRTFETVKVPKAIPAETFTLKIPAGTRIADKVKGLFYTVGPDGGPAPGTKTMPIQPADPPKKPSDRDEPPEAFSVGVGPPEPRNWVLYAGVVLVVGGVVSLLVRRRARSAA